MNQCGDYTKIWLNYTIFFNVYLENLALKDIIIFLPNFVLEVMVSNSALLSSSEEECNSGGSISWDGVTEGQSGTRCPCNVVGTQERRVLALYKVLDQVFLMWT